MAAAPNSQIVLTDPVGGIDKLQGDIKEVFGLDDGQPSAEEAKEESKAPAGVKVEDFEALRETAKKLEDRLTQSEMTNRYLAGALQERKSGEAPLKDETPKELSLDFDAITKDIETRGSQALVDVVRKVVQHEREGIERAIDERMNQRLGARDASQNRAARFQAELNECVAEYGDLWQDEAFKNAADEEAQRLLVARGGKTNNDYQPGDLIAAAGRAYTKWVKTGKIKLDALQTEQSSARPALREIVRRVPRNDDLGANGSQHRTGSPRTIDELFTNQRERDQAKLVAKRLGVPEERWVKSYLAAQQEDEDFGK